MNGEEILKLIDAGFSADEIRKMQTSDVSEDDKKEPSASGQEHEGEYDEGQLHAEGFDTQPSAELTPLGSVGSHRRYTAL